MTKGAAAVIITAAALFGLLSCGADTGSPGQGGGVTSPSTTNPGPPAPVKTGPAIQTVTPDFSELRVDTSPAAAGDTVPWKLVKVDTVNNRIYLSSEQVSCTVPEVVHLQETRTEIVIAVAGAPTSMTCAARKVSLIGYVQLNDPLAGRRVVGNSQ
ncbi:hypothetical protein [Arthrobacter sp. UYEF21]|uniref:hypothetical protein n=1 Tax=Arthrobacter sp. UYEF21 TaxID=1756364 RepID=UPI0033958635